MYVSCKHSYFLRNIPAFIGMMSGTMLRAIAKQQAKKRMHSHRTVSTFAMTASKF
jgi:hypothetical protein